MPFPKVLIFDYRNRFSYIIALFRWLLLWRGSNMANKEGWVGIVEVAAHLVLQSQLVS